MRVLRVISGVDPAMGGPPVASLNSTLASQRAGIGTSVVFPFDETFEANARQLATRLEADGIFVRPFLLWARFPSRSRRWGISFPLVRWVAREAHRYDAIHAEGGWTVSTLAALAAARIARRPAVLTPHEALTDFDIEKSGQLGRVFKRAVRSLYRRSFDLFIFPSELECRDTFGAAAAGSVVVYHPVIADTEPGDNRSSRRIGFLGRLAAKKNVDVVIRALELLPPDVTLLIAGTGPLEENLRRLADEVGVTDRIEWLGFITGEQKAGFFARIGALAMPSANECFGVSGAEAMVYGVPVVVSSGVGLAEIIEPAGAGLVVEPTPHALARALRSVLDDDGLRSRLATRGVDVAARELSLEVHGRRLREAYERLPRVRQRAARPTLIIR